MVLIQSCSTQKNTALSRSFHSTKVKYNILYNGNNAYEEGLKMIASAHEENYQQVIPLYPVSDHRAAESAKSKMDLTIEKCRKCIKLHSIKKRPKVNSKKSATDEKYRAWLKHEEFNPSMHLAWLRLGQAEFHKGDFLGSIGTFNYIQRHYSYDKDLVAQCQLWAVRAYAEMGWIYEAEDLLQKVQIDDLSRKHASLYSAAAADLMMKQERWREAIPHVKIAKEDEKRKQNRPRFEYALGQLYELQGNNGAAAEAYRRCIKLTPAWDMDFNARLRLSQLVSDQKQAVKDLDRMIRLDKYKEYLDQLYGAKGDILLRKGDTLGALEQYAKAAEESTRMGIDKAAALIKAGDIYFQRREYAKAQPCYAAALSIISAETDDYKRLSKRSEVLDGLVLHQTTVELQDSLQRLAKLSPEEQQRVCEKIVADLIEQERQDSIRAAEEARRAANDAMDGPTSVNTNGMLGGNSGSTEWYFYNQQLLAAGRQAFRQQWGQRKLEDNWRRQDRTVLLQDMSDETAAQDQPQDSIAAAADSAVTAITETDPHTRQYYYQQIPFTEEQKLESDRLTSSSLLGAGIIYKDRLSEYEAAEKSLRRIIDDYPQSDESDVAMYNLYLMYSLWDRPEQAAQCMEYMKEQWPEGAYTKMISDPDYLDNARYGKHREDSIYAETYDAFRAGDNDLVRRNCAVSSEKYPKGANRAKFMFLEASVCMQDGDMDHFLEILKEIVRDYPEEEISHLSGQIAQGIADGRILQSTSLASIWDRRSGTVQDSLQTDSMRPQFGTGRYEPFLVVIAYPDGEVNVNRLTFEMFRYTFSTYMMRTFDITPDVSQGIGLLKIGEFISFDEAYMFCQNLYSDAGMAEKLSGMKTLIITPDNLDILLRHYSFNDYQEFYEENFMNIPEFDIDASTLFEEYDDGK